MNKTLLVILLSVFPFIAINTIFYINIYKKQRIFQTELLSQQIHICGNTIEQNGLNFENEVNYILYSEDITKLFQDPSTKEEGSRNLELFYTKYDQLINNINIYDNNKNVYRLFKDMKDNYVSDYYESQKQVTLLSREQLVKEDDKYSFSIPVFKDNKVQANIVIGIDFERFINSVFSQYRLENTLLQWLITDDSTLISVDNKSLLVYPSDFEKITTALLNEQEGSLMQTLKIGDESNKVISVYYPVHILHKDFVIVFSIKSDLFLRYILQKIIIITLASLILLSLILYIHLHTIKVKSRHAATYMLSEQALKTAIDNLPVGLITFTPDEKIRAINKTAKDFLMIGDSNQIEDLSYSDFTFDHPDQSEKTIYEKAFGPGEIIKVKKNKHENLLFKKEITTELQKETVTIIILVDISSFEKVRKLEKLGHIAKTNLLENMSHEISVPLITIREIIQKLITHKLPDEANQLVLSIQKSTELLTNLVNTVIDFSGMDTHSLIQEEIPFNLRSEINLSLESLKPLSTKKNISLITKIRNDVPDKLIGDPFQLRIILQNLIENSIDLTKEGRILISVENLEHQKDHIKLLFQIEDTGQPLPFDNIETLIDALDLSKDLEKSGKPGELEFRIALSKQHVELMKGNIWIESPSDISTNPKFPGTKYSFTIEALTETSHKKNLNFSSVHNFNEIQCLFLCQEKETASTSQELFKDMGVTLKQRIYNKDRVHSILQYIEEKIDEYHLLVIFDKPQEDGFTLAKALHENKLSEKFLILMISSNDQQGNYSKCRKYEVDYYLVQPFENHRLFEIIHTHFSGIPVEKFKHAPKGATIKPNLSILLAEDNLFSRKIGQTMFKSLGYEIDLAKNGKEVIEMVKQKPYDILFLDLLMPELDGLETALELRKNEYKIPIIAITAIDSEETKNDAIKAGMNDYLIKPIGIDSIRKVLLQYFSEPAK